MTLPVRIDSDALADLRDAFEGYESVRSGLGSEFAQDANATIERLRVSPHSYREFEPGFRRLHCRRFPYHVYFAIEVDAVVIVAIYHDARDPSRWRPESRSTSDPAG